MLSHSLKRKTIVSQLVWKIVGEQKCQHTYFCRNLHKLASWQSLPRTIQRPSFKCYASSTNNDDSDDRTSTSNNANSNLIYIQPTTVRFKSEQDLLNYLDQLLTTNNSSEVVEMAEQYLFDRHSLPARFAGTLSYQKVLEAWCNLEEMDRAESLLNQIHHNYVNKKSEVASNYYQFRIVLYGYRQILVKEASQGQHHEYATKIETLIQKMIEWHEQFGYDTKPRYIDYEMLFQSMRYSDEPDPEKAERIFWEMMEQYDDGDETLVPTTDHFSYILRLWILAQRKNLVNREVAADRSLALYDEAKKRSIPLDGYCYQFLIEIQRLYSRFDRAETIYEEMMSLFQAGDESMKPNMRTLESMLNVRSKVGNPTGAQEIFTEMLKEWKLGGNLNYKPNAKHLTLLLLAWSNSDHSDAAEKAHELIRRLNRLTTDATLRPNIVSYAVVIKCYNRSKNPDAGKYVLDLYQEVKAQQHLRPDLIFYLEVLAAIMKSYTYHKYVSVDDSGSDDDIVNDDDSHHVVAMVDTIQQILTNDINEIPDSVWQRTGSVYVCNAVIDLLQRHQVPHWEQLISYMQTKLRQKTKRNNEVSEYE